MSDRPPRTSASIDPSLPRPGASAYEWTPDASDLPSKDGRKLVGPPLEGLAVFLKPVTPEDYRFMQHMETEGGLGVRGHFRGATPSPEQWAQATWSGVLAQFLVIPKHGDRPIGLVSAFRANFQDGHAQLSATSFDPDRIEPLMAIGVAVFLDYVFACWNFHKLYVELPEYDLAPIAGGAGRLFEIEARLQDHSFLAGRAWDEFIVAVYRDRWRQHRGALLHGCDARPTSGSATPDKWAGFTAELAPLAGRPASEIERDLGLVHDLGLDALALAELVVSLLDAFDGSALAEAAPRLAWEQLTVAELFAFVVQPADVV